jgi:hypothetical protein
MAFHSRPSNTPQSHTLKITAESSGSTLSFRNPKFAMVPYESTESRLGNLVAGYELLLHVEKIAPLVIQCVCRIPSSGHNDPEIFEYIPQWPWLFAQSIQYGENSIILPWKRLLCLISCVRSVTKRNTNPLARFVEPMLSTEWEASDFDVWMQFMNNAVDF